MKMVDFKLYLITDRMQVANRDLMNTVEAALKGGVPAVQLREKDLSDRQIYELGVKLRVLTRKHGARLFVNDRADIVSAVDADGVHLTQAGYCPKDARRILGAEKLIGVSTHSLAQAEAAEVEGADFITLGPVFDTPSKRQYGPPVGTKLVREVTRVIRIPVFGIGGIKPELFSDVSRAGAHGVALISGILAAGNVRKAAERFAALVHGSQSAVNRV